MTGRYTNFQYTPLPTHMHSHHQYHSPEWYFLTEDEHILIHHNHLGSTDHLNIHSKSSEYVTPSMGLDKCIMTYNHHYIIKYFHCPKKLLYTLYSSALSPQIPGIHWSFYCLHGFTISIMAYSWTHFLFSWKEKFKAFMTVRPFMAHPCMDQTGYRWQTLPLNTAT